MSDDVPFDVLNDFPETGDLSTQVGGDVIDAAKGVRFTIQKVDPRVVEKDGVKLMAKLNVRAAVGPLGVDGNGKYANKNLFAELIVWINEEKYNSDWWKKQARFPYKSFLKALAFDPATPPKVTDEFLTLLKGKEFVADISKVEMQIKGEDGKWVGTGDFKNELKNFKAVEA